MNIKKIIIIFIAIVAVIGVSFFVAKRYLHKDETFFQKILGPAGISMNGKAACNVMVHNDNFINRVISNGSIGLGESYMDGWWDCAALDDLFYRIFRFDIPNKVPQDLNTLLLYLKAKLMNMQSVSRAFEVGQEHYDLGNDLFQKMLDKNMQYSCAYWKNADTLEKAQEHKLDLICQKLYLKPGMKLLDIGCGWGGLALHAAKNYGVKVVGVTISKEQAKHAQNLTKDYPVEIRLQDYRDLDEPFDRIVSVGMFEHVGYKNYKTFMDVAHKLLKDDGLLLLHTIGGNSTQICGDPWLNKYIFPNGMLPSIEQIAQASPDRFIMEDWHNFGADYDKTLMAWYKNFLKAWPTLKDDYNDRFYRMWTYYLLSCAGLFRARAIQLWQIVFAKKGVEDGYTSIR